ncbi:ATP-dependent DNA ligase [Candidatus Methanarcanum hacksteinii]|uniref:ATP-dependent DNA ligase n=1 Tax=Candidatus Methanarcanum hacksteinii TaxID=2911857 RepID=UPI0037DCCD45
MDFTDIAKMFDRLESTSARLEMTAILADFFKDCNPDDLRSIIYLSQGKLHPDFYGVELGMADKLVLRAIAFTSGTKDSKVEEMWVKEGDPGAVAEKLIGTKKQMTLFSEPLTLDRVVKGLTLIETAEGKDSQDKKMKHLANLLHDSGPLEARYLCRIVTGRMRIGASTMTILDALSIAFATKEDRESVERAFNVTCDLGLVAETICRSGIDGIQRIQVTIGNPIKVMLAERLPSIGEVVSKMGGECAIEYKYDGIRAQVHIGKDSVKIYSRRLEDLTPNFPDIAQALREHFKGTEAIIEGECVAVDAETGYMQSFQEVTHRRRKHGMDDAVKEVPVRIFMFDMLYVDGKDMTTTPYLQRRSALTEWFDISDNVQMSTMRIVHSEDEGEEFFEEAITARCEGVMAKSISDDSIYRAGSRGFLWIKYKKDYQENLTDSFDLSVVGAFYGMGKRAGKYGALLMASYDPEIERFGTVCKLGTGFDDAFLDGMPALLDGYKTSKRPSSLDAKMIPDVWFEPHVVLEVVAAEITVSPNHTAGMGMIKDDSGLGIRFPRFTGRVRDDKDAEQCTTVQEIMEMYEMQAHDSTGIDE